MKTIYYGSKQFIAGPLKGHKVHISWTSVGFNWAHIKVCVYHRKAQKVHVEFDESLRVISKNWDLPEGTYVISERTNNYYAPEQMLWSIVSRIKSITVGIDFDADPKCVTQELYRALN